MLSGELNKGEENPWTPSALPGGPPAGLLALQIHGAVVRAQLLHQDLDANLGI